MKIKILSLAALTICITLFSGCDAKVNNALTFQNLAAGTVYINFRGSAFTVAPGKSQTITEIPKGNYSYSTTYSIPFGATSTTVSGPVSGTLTMKAGTKVFILYSSALLNGNYIFSASISSSDEVIETGPTNP